MSTLRAAVHRLIDPVGPDRVVVACSGGADSMALADAAIAELGAVRVVVAHVDHGLQPGSAEVAAAVVAWARGQGATAVVREVAVVRTGSLEAAARDARLAALEHVADEHGAPQIWLAHTRRDQVETVLMRIVRGTGPAGVAGIAPVRGRFVRPLLDVPREVVDAYVVERGLPSWPDPMNADLAITRIRFREQHLPALRRENPALDDALVRLAASAREWLAAIDRIAQPFAAFPMSCGELAGQEPAITKRALALALDRARIGYDAAHLDRLDALVRAPAGGATGIDLPGGRIVRSYDRLELEHADGPLAPLVAPAGYELRAWREGDRMKPARLKGRSRKLSDLYIDAKVPREVRRSARVLVRASDRAIVWAEHLGLAFGEPDRLVPVPA